jgi:hypothetical protein
LFWNRCHFSDVVDFDIMKWLSRNAMHQRSCNQEIPLTQFPWNEEATAGDKLLCEIAIWCSRWMLPAPQRQISVDWLSWHFQNPHILYNNASKIEWFAWHFSGAAVKDEWPNLVIHKIWSVSSQLYDVSCFIKPISYSDLVWCGVSKSQC